MHKIEAKKLPFGDRTEDGAYYPKVDGYNVGENGRAFWPTHEEALAVAQRYAAHLTANA